MSNTGGRRTGHFWSFIVFTPNFPLHCRATTYTKICNAVRPNTMSCDVPPIVSQSAYPGNQTLPWTRAQRVRSECRGHRHWPAAPLRTLPPESAKMSLSQSPPTAGSAMNSICFVAYRHSNQSTSGASWAAYFQNFLLPSSFETRSCWGHAMALTNTVANVCMCKLNSSSSSLQDLLQPLPW